MDIKDYEISIARQILVSVNELKEFQKELLVSDFKGSLMPIYTAITRLQLLKDSELGYLLNKANQI